MSTEQRTKGLKPTMEGFSIARGSASAPGLARIADRFDIYGTAPGAVVAATAKAEKNLSKSGVTAPDFIETLKKQKLVHFAATMTKHVSEL